MHGMRKILVLAGSLVAVGSLGGCQWFHRTVGDIGETYNTNPVVTYPDEKALPQNTNFPPAIDLDSYRFPGEPQSTKVAYLQATADISGATRDRLMAIFMERSDRICAIMKSDIAGLNDTVNFSLGEITTVLGGVGAIVTGAGAARALAGSAAITNATRAQFNEVFYQNAVKTAILRAIDASRTTKATALTQHIANGLAAYPVETIIRDVNTYNDACSFYNGLAALTQSPGTVPDSAQSITAKIAALQQQITNDQQQIDTLTAKLAGATNPQKIVLQRQIDNLEQAKEFATQAIASLTAQLTLVRGSP